MNNMYRYNTQSASGFEAIYALGELCGENAFRREIISGSLPSGGRSQNDIDTQGLVEATRYREGQEATISNFTNDAAGFDHQFAAGYIVAFLNEQDAFLVDPKGYLVEMHRCTPSLPEARIIDGKLTSPHDEETL